MHNYDPLRIFIDEDKIEETPGLGEAYALANSALDEGLGLSHWKNELRRSPIVISSDDEDTEDTPPYSSDDTDDLALQQALQQSREEYYGKKPITNFATSLTPPLSSPQRFHRSTSASHTATLIPYDSELRLSLPRTPFRRSLATPPQI